MRCCRAYTDPIRVDKLPYDLRKLRRYLERLGPSATLRVCYEASGAGYVLQRALLSGVSHVP